MKQFAGWYFPDNEEHMIGWMSNSKNSSLVEDGRVMYQGKKIKAAMSHCRSFRVACDVGGHCGTWSFYLAKKFKSVHAFEPIAEHARCFKANVEADNVSLHECALGERPGMVGMITEPNSTGGTRVNGDGSLPMKTLDSFNLNDVDFIKLDCEGYELHALRGGEKTIKRCRPVIIVEQKPGRAQRFGLAEHGAVDYLKTLGYTLAQELSGDFIMLPPEGGVEEEPAEEPVKPLPVASVVAESVESLNPEAVVTQLGVIAGVQPNGQPLAGTPGRTSGRLSLPKK